ncbi:MAG: methyltransferase-like protein [Sphingomonas bacterium]|nr:methyltransferase [Sphingomonas bacterium]MDB5689242.1 methyltransferase-like protein [Sphingomonas bacterium]
MRYPVLLACLLATVPGFAAAPAAARPGPAAAGVPKALATAVADPRRSPASRARDRYRHPAETLAFFGIRPDMTVVEIWPGGGWYAEILAPLLQGRGRYIAAAQGPGRGRDATEKLIASDPARFSRVALTTFDPKATSTIAPAGSADMVLTFRNVHNFLMAGDAAAAQAFTDFHKALKPGGVLGIVDHRLPEDRPADAERKSGYLKRSTIVRLATAAGFRLAGESQVNANPKDSADWPDGVWTLPPVLRRGEADRARYLAIGESDRMTLKFVKPAA